eukprot:1181397-Amphidinium_carterae.2
MADETRKHYITITAEGLPIQGWKETTLIIGTITMQVCFIVDIVQSPLIGLPDLNDNKTTIHTGDNPYIEQRGWIQLDNTVNTSHSPTSAPALIIGDIEELSQQANIPRQLRQPPQPTKQEQEEHRTTDRSGNDNRAWQFPP